MNESPLPPPEPQVPPPPPPPGPGRPPYHGGPPYHSDYYSYYGGYYTDNYYRADSGQTPGPLGAINIHRLIRVLRRKWLTIALVTGLGAAGAAFYLHRTPKVYSATSRIELSVRRPRIMAVQGPVMDDQTFASFDEALSTKLEKLRTRESIEAVLKEYRKNVPNDARSDDELRGLLSPGVQFTQVRKTRLVNLTFVSQDPQFAADAATAFAEAMVTMSTDENRSQSDFAVAWLEKQATQQKTLLEKADQALNDFRSKNKLDAMENEKRTVESSLAAFNTSLVGLQSQETSAREVMKVLDGLKFTPEEIGKLPSSIPRAEEIGAAMERLNVAIADHDSMLLRYTKKHPEVQTREEAINLARTNVFDTVARARESGQAELALMKQQMASLEKKIAEQSAKAGEIDARILDAKLGMGALEREKEACDITYRGILNRIEEARLSADENTATVKVTDHAVRPSEPFEPRPVKTFTSAVLAGLLAGFLLALLIDVMEDLISLPQEVERDIGLRVMAVLPHVWSKKRAEIAQACVHRRFGQMAEAFAGLRSMLDSPNIREQTKTIMLASAMPGAGKTIVACNLAVSFAKKGQRMLLIDFDMRRPRVGRIFEMPDKHRALLDFLKKGEVTGFDRIVWRTSVPNFEIIGSRAAKDESPADLVSGDAVRELVEWAKHTYDRVILDVPPLGLVSDAAVLATMAGCVLIVVRPEASRKRATRHIAAQFRDLGVSLLAAVVNDVDFRRSNYYYTQGYYYHPYGGYKSDKKDREENESAT